MARIRSERVQTNLARHVVVGALALGAMLVVPQMALAGFEPTPHPCPVANCTANDLQPIISGVAFESDPTCEDSMDTVDIEITHVMTVGGTRYDIGLYITSDPETNTCLVDILSDTNSTVSPMSTSIYQDGDGQPGGAGDCYDAGVPGSGCCGDIENQATVTHVNVFTVDCTDNDHDGFLDPVTIWESWANNPTQINEGGFCDRVNVFEGTTAKCRVDMPMPEIVVPPTCGDGFTTAPEQCDDGNTLDGDGCNATCQLEYCGDDIVNNNGTETCDDGNTVGGDGCSAICQEEICGNGFVDVGEECDDGNTVDGDSCSNECVAQYCGDGVITEGLGEECDDSNTTSGDGCSANCLVEACGNGRVDFGEQCDDGNTVAGDGCNEVCEFEGCGNGVVDVGEACDDGNTVNDDACSNECVINYCGDGITQEPLGETCDDGNEINGDGCDDNCQIEVPAVDESGLLLLGVLLAGAGAVALKKSSLI